MNPYTYFKFDRIERLYRSKNPDHIRALKADLDRRGEVSIRMVKPPFKLPAGTRLNWKDHQIFISGFGWLEVESVCFFWNKGE